MRLLYFDAPAGVAGDMFAGSLLDAGASWEAVREAVSSLHLEGVEVFMQKTRRGGLSATKFDVIDTASGRPVEEVGRREFQSPADLVARIERGRLSEEVRRHAVAILRNLAQAEAKVHGVPVETVHFHEIGAADTLVDIVAACAAFCSFGPVVTCGGPVAVGSGTVRCAHGTLPVPAPATLELLHGVPIFAGEVEAEMTTPTGAALLTHFCRHFGRMPPLSVEAVGYGAGSREFSVPNVFRTVVGRMEEPV
jgi:uncharacterized protein (TIGR00299 family) protein